MDEQTQSPNEQPVISDTQVADAAVEDVQAQDGQGTTETGEQSPQSPQVPFEERWTQFITKKGWEAEKAQQQLLDSYESLEGKLGNWSDVETKAKWVDENYDHVTAMSDKARMWDESQKKLEEMKQNFQFQEGKIDLNQAKTDVLASLWKSGQVSLSDLPPQRQYEVQRFAQEQDQAIENASRAQAVELSERYPILKNPQVANLVADYIDKGMEPEKAITQVQGLLSTFEKQGEERIKKNMEALKSGNLERTSSAAPTQSKLKTTSVRDAYLWAKEHGDGN